MNKYELVYIITPDIEEEARKVVHTRVQDLIAQNGTLTPPPPRNMRKGLYGFIFLSNDRVFYCTILHNML